jgi:hypothetical protein
MATLNKGDSEFFPVPVFHGLDFNLNYHFQFSKCKNIY